MITFQICFVGFKFRVLIKMCQNAILFKHVKRDDGINYCDFSLSFEFYVILLLVVEHGCIAFVNCCTFYI